MSGYQVKGSEMRTYALGVLVAGIASLFISIGVIVGIAIGLAGVSFLFEG